jgi:glycosyltransferase involved in cell wall biosynthesis
MIGSEAMPHRLLVVHQLDPRGRKVGGIETHVRLLLAHCPPDVSLVLAGIDEIGDLRLGEVVPLEVGGRRIDFLPVLRVPADTVTGPAKSLSQSLTLRFGLALARHLPALRRALGKGPGSIELERYEYAALARLLRRPVVQLIHNEYAKSNKTDSLLTRYWAVHEQCERLALGVAGRIVCVTDGIRRHVAEQFPRYAGKAVVMSVPVDTGLFRPTPLELADGVLRLVYTGRLEAQKDPGLMFETIAHLARRLEGKVELHYVGTGDPEAYPEFAAVRAHVVRHGFQSAAGVAEILSRCHMGLLTSNFEGMPCFIMEVIASGRSMAAIRLPQFDAVVRAGETGVLSERRATQPESAAALAEAIARHWTDVQAGRFPPAMVARNAEPYSVATQLPRLFAWHRELAGTPPSAAALATGRPAPAE